MRSIGSANSPSSSVGLSGVLSFANCSRREGLSRCSSAMHHRLHRSPSAILSVSCAASHPLPLCESPKGMLPVCDAFAPVPLLAPVGGECSLGPYWFCPGSRQTGAFCARTSTGTHACVRYSAPVQSTAATGFSFRPGLRNGRNLRQCQELNF